MAADGGEYMRIPLDRIERDENQPRRRFRPPPAATAAKLDVGVGKSEEIPDPDIEAAIDDDVNETTSLTDSILAQGVIQPILVERIGDETAETQYRIIAGERRWEAAKRARDRVDTGDVDADVIKPDYDYQTIPAMVVDGLSDTNRLEMQLIENIQRRGMEDDDVGHALKRLRDRYGMTYNDIARRIGRSTSYVMDVLFAVDETGQKLRWDLKSTDWNYLRRLHSQKKKHPEIYKHIMARCAAGEPFSRKLFDEVVRKHEEEIHAANRKGTVEAMRAAADARKAEADRRRQEAIAEQARRDDVDEQRLEDVEAAVLMSPRSEAQRATSRFGNQPHAADRVFRGKKEWSKKEKAEMRRDIAEEPEDALYKWGQADGFFRLHYDLDVSDDSESLPALPAENPILISRRRPLPPPDQPERRGPETAKITLGRAEAAELAMLVELLYVQPKLLKSLMDEYDATEPDEKQDIRNQSLDWTIDRLGEVARLLVEERKTRIAAGGQASTEDDDDAA